MAHQRIILSGPTIDGPPGLPPELIGTLTDETLADIEAASDPCPPGFEGIGYWRIQPAAPVPDGKISVEQHVELIDGQPTWVHTLEDAPPPPFAPLSGRQISLALRSIDITDAMVEAEISAGIADPMERDMALIEWRRAGQFERGHPLIDQMADAFDLPTEQVDSLWRWAAGI